MSGRKQKPAPSPAVRRLALQRGAKLLALRMAADLSQDDFAEFLGMSRHGYAFLERGDRVGLASDTALRIAKLTHIPLQELIIG